MAMKRLGLLALALAGACCNLPGPAQASDLYQPYGRYEPSPGYYEPPVARGPVYGEPRYAPPAVQRRVEADEGRCRVFYRRHIDAYGREVRRRVRVCDEGVVEPSPRWAERSPHSGYEPQIYDAPRPPRVVRPNWDDDLD